MRFLRARIAAATLMVVLVGGVQAQTNGRISAVRVYRGQALVTREVPFNAQAGAQELVVGELPERIEPSSLYATAGEGLTIRAVRFRTTAVGEEPREEVRELDRQIEEAQDKLLQTQADLDVLERREAYLDKLEGFVAPTAEVELTKGVLDAETLKQLVEFTSQQRTTISQDRLRIQREQKQLQADLTLLQRRRAELMAGGTSAQREAVVFLEAGQAGPATVELNYLVGGVGWSPAYIARLNGARDQLLLEYHGLVTQYSGEDWSDVELTLSTSYPSMQAVPPVLSPLWIALTSAQQEEERAAGDKDQAREYARRRAELQQGLRGQAGREGKPGAPGAQGPVGAPGEPMMPGAGGLGAAAMPNQQAAADDLYTWNVNAARLQQLELAASDDAIKRSRATGGEAAAMAVEYQLPGRASLQSRNDQQMLRIGTIDLPATFFYSAVPLLTEYVYQAAEAVNNSNYPLLPGPYTAYLDGAFAGQGSLPLLARGQALTIGFGTESQLRATRDLDDKTTEVRGGNNLLRFTYRLRFQNYTDRPVRLRAWDRLPQPPNNQVSVTMINPGPPLSEDPLYVQQEKPLGLLRWDIDVPAGASGPNAHSFTYEFQLEFDKSFTIGELPAESIERMKRDLGGLGALHGLY